MSLASGSRVKYRSTGAICRRMESTHLFRDERTMECESQGSWTAISRTPFFKGARRFPKGDCWHGGGLWTGNDTYWLNDGYGHTVLRNARSFRRDPNGAAFKNYGGECLGVYYPRLVRDGSGAHRTCEAWEVFKRNRVHKTRRQGMGPAKLAHAEVDHPAGKGCYWDEHELAPPGPGRRSLARPGNGPSSTETPGFRAAMVN